MLNAGNLVVSVFDAVLSITVCSRSYFLDCRGIGGGAESYLVFLYSFEQFCSEAILFSSLFLSEGRSFILE